MSSVIELGVECVVLQTETGEQITLPISALPSEFVSGEGGQVIMVEESSAPEQQEIVLGSECNIAVDNGPHELQVAERVVCSEVEHMPMDNNQDLTEHQQMEIPQQVELATLTQVPSGLHHTISVGSPQESPTTIITNQENMTHLEQLKTSGLNMLSNSTKTYSRKTISLANCSFTSNTSTCGPAKVKLTKAEANPQLNQIDITSTDQDVSSADPVEQAMVASQIFQVTTPELIEKQQQDPEEGIKHESNVERSDQQETLEQPHQQPEQQPEEQQLEKLQEPILPAKSPRRRKAEISTRPLNEEDSIMEFQEVPPYVETPPHRGYRRNMTKTKTNRKATPRPIPRSSSTEKREKIDSERKRPKREPKERKSTTTKSVNFDLPPTSPDKREKTPEKTVVVTPDPTKNYSCKECGFSTDRINNLVVHMKDTCSFAKKRWQCELEKIKSSLNKSKN